MKEILWTGNPVSSVEEQMNSKELAKQIKASPDDITYWARKGKIPGRKIGRQWRFNQKSLMAAKERIELLNR